MGKENNSLIVIPALNEESTIGGVVDGIKNHIFEADILVVNDGSIDNTADIAERHGAGVISLPFNLGYGAALETGYKYAHENGYKYVLQMDADGQHEASCLNDLICILKNDVADVVIGSRFLKECGYKTLFMRQTGMAIFSKITSMLTRKKITDSTSGFQGVNRKVLKFFIDEYYPSDYPDADMIISLDRAGFRVVETPVIMYSKQNKKSMHSGFFKPIYYVFKMFLSISMIFLRKNPNK